MMKLRGLFALALVLCTGAATAEDAWLLTHTADRYVLQSSGKELRRVSETGSRPTFGVSPDAIALLSHRPTMGGPVLEIIDRKSQQVISSWPVTGTPLSELGGPSQAIHLTSDAAYFTTAHLADGTTRNRLGGSFDFNRVSRSDGTQVSYPLPEYATSPRVTELGDIPLIYSWNGFGVWKFDVEQEKLVQLVRAGDVSDILSREITTQRAGNLPQKAHADFIAVPGNGVFRLSKLGELHQVLHADLTLVKQPRPTLDLGGDSIADIVTLASDAGALICILRKRTAGVSLQYIDATSLKVKGELTLPGAIDTTRISAFGSHVFYIDRAQGQIRKASPTGTDAVRGANLKGDLSSSTLLFIDAAS